MWLAATPTTHSLLQDTSQVLVNDVQVVGNLTGIVSVLGKGPEFADVLWRHDKLLMSWL
jgi:hypothetical protein